MPGIRNGSYNDRPKGYLTYPIKTGDINSAGIMGVLLKEKSDVRYIVDFGDKTINEKRVTAPLAKELMKMGIRVTIKTVKTTKGINKISITINNTVKVIPIEVHKIFNASVLQEIQIRVTADTEGELLINMYAIQNVLDKWQIKPKECLWAQGGWTEASTKPLVDNKIIAKEQLRLNEILNKVEDLQDKVDSLQKAPLRNATKEDRKVRAGILK
jgi:hypothetical protein